MPQFRGLAGFIVPLSNLFYTQGRISKLMAPLALAAALAGCGGGGGGGGGSSTSTGDSTLFNNKSTAPITAAQKTTAATAVDTAWLAAGSQSAANQNQTLIALMTKTSAFQQGGITADGNVWGRFTDGSPIVFLTNDQTTPPTTPAKSSPAAKPPALAKAAASRAASVTVNPMVATDQLVSNNVAFVLDPSEPAVGSSLSSIASWLGGYGYAVTYSKGGLADWANVSGAGVVVTFARGDTFNQHYYITTSDIETSALDNQYAAALSSGQLVVAHIRVYDTATTYHMEAHYGFDADYLESLPNAKTMFSKVSLFINGCGNGTSTVGLAMASALEDSSGLALYGGWNWSIRGYDSDETLQFFFDRALGLDQVAPIDPTNPAPMLISEVYSKMGTTDRQDGTPTEMSLGPPTANPRTGVVGTAAWSWSAAPSYTRATIIPSINTLTEDDVAGTLTLDGNFGPNQGSVLVAGNYLTIKSWTPDTIVTSVPSTGGRLLVYGPTDVSGYIKSNPLTFTPLSVSITPSSPVDFGAQQVYTATVTGAAPSSGLSYQWSLSGGGSLAGGNPVVTTTPTVTYTAPSTAGTATLTVKLLDVNKNVLTQGTVTIPIGNVGMVTITNNFTSQYTSFNGTYTAIQIPVQAKGSDSAVEKIPSPPLEQRLRGESGVQLPQ